MGTTLADYYIQIMPSADGISGQLSNIMDGEATSAGTSSGSKFSSAFTSGLKTVATGATVALTAVSTGIAAVTKSSVENYAEYEQLVGGVETLFGTQGQSLEEYADSIGSTVEEASASYAALENAQSTVLENASNAYKTAGLSANDYMEQATSTAASLISSLGGDTEAAAALADQAITDMSDNANKMGTDIESIQNAYSGFAKGNYTMLDNLKLGYGGTKEEMERLLEDAEALSGVEYDISSYADITEAIHVIQEDMGIAGTTAKEAQETISGSLSMVSASWSNLLTGMADENADLDSLISEFVDSVSIAADNLLPVIETALEGAGDVIEGLVPEIMDEIPSLITETLPSLVDSGISIIESILDGITENAGLLGDSAITMVTNITTSFVSLLPQLVSTGLTILTSILNGIGQNIGSVITTVTSVVLEITNTLISNIPLLIDAGLSIFLGILDGLIEAIPMIIDEIPTLIDSIISVLTEATPQILEGATTMFLALVDALPEITDSLVEAIPTVIDSVVEFLTGDGFSSILDAAITMFIAIVEALPEIIEALLGALADLIVDFIADFPEHWEDIKQGAKDLWTKIVDAVGDIWDALSTALGTLVDDAVAKVKEFWQDFKDAGTYLMEGLKEGMKSVDLTVVGANSTSAVLSAINSTAEVNSPSKATMRTGKALAEGLAIGWENEMTSVNKEISDDMTFQGSMSVSSADVNSNTLSSTANGTTFTLYETVSLDGTPIKDIISTYTLTKIGDETRAVKVAQGAYV